MADIADIGFRADTGGLKDAKSSLDALVPAADRAEKSSVKLSSTLAKVDASADKLMAAAVGLSSAVDKMSAVLDRSAGSATTANASYGNLNVTAGKTSVTFNGVAAAASGAGAAITAAAGAANAATGAMNNQAGAANAAGASIDQLDAHVSAYRANLRQLQIDQMAAGAGTQQLDAHMMAYRDHLDKVGAGAKAAGAAIKFTAQDSLNATRQLADIGVTAATGMSPFMIAIQQGPQLLDILQNKAAMTGQSLGAVFRAAGAAIWAALLPILPIIAGIALAVGVVAAAFGLATRQITKGNEDIAKGLGLTEKQMERVKKAGVDTGVTIGDTFKATFEVLGERITGAAEKPIKAFSKAWNTAMDQYTETGRAAIKDVIGTFVGGYFAIVALWKTLPNTFSGIGALIANGFIAMIEGMINRAVQQINGINSKLNEASSAVGLGNIFTMLDPVKMGRVANAQAAASADAISKGYAEGYAKAGAATDRFFADVGKRARKNRRKLIEDAAGDAEKGPKTPKGPKTDAAKFEDIVTGANADIAKENARAAAAGINMTAEAAATLEQKTKLLNQAQEKGIKLTDAMRSTIDQLAGAYGKAKVAADNAVGLKDVLKSADADIANIKAQADMIGLYGRQLAYATEMTKLLAEAKSKGMTPDAIAAAKPQFEAKANTFADASASLANQQFMEDQRKAAAERMITLKQEQAQIGLSVDETNRLRIENELLAAARQKNIDLSPADVAALKGIAAEQAATEAAIRKTKEALDFTKDATKGFFADLRSGLEQGKGLWQSFGDAVLGVLNKIINKLMDKLLDSAIDNLFAGMNGSNNGGGNSGGGFFGSLLNNLGAGLFGGKKSTATASPTFGGGSQGNPTGVLSYAADGAAFTNNIFNKPTAFAFGRGGVNIGIMGEAGDEAVMPLQRGPDGSLGVQMYGGTGGGGTIIHAPITVKNDNRVTGAVSSGDIVEMQRRSAEQTTRDIKRQIPEILQQYQRDGTMV